ncbi:MAG: trypsin-like peptidase domain-containing protein, partial [Chitinophagaceae bacterium]|nr:trypsin-like peptidase domain-containing protein [Chitinophagaceae bacterium]
MAKNRTRKDVDDLKKDIEAAAFKRWTERKTFREDPADYLEKNRDEKAKLELRYNTYNKREQKRAGAQLVQPLEVKIRSLERQIGDTIDFRRRPATPEAYKFGTPVGRIYQIPDKGLEIEAFGTGFLITPELMITNHHVFPYKDYAEGCAINFQHEYNEFGKLQSGLRFNLDPSKFYFSDEKLDFAIVYVKSVDDTGARKLSELGCIPLIETKGKIVLEDPINIVQYPLGQFKQYTTENNFVKDILEEKGYIQYTTDTAEASSGSPAANKYWEVAALHHCGIALTVNDKIWSRFEKPWDSNTMTDGDKIYIANEGVSISRIVGFLKKQNFANNEHNELVKSILLNGRDKILDS